MPLLKHVFIVTITVTPVMDPPMVIVLPVSVDTSNTIPPLPDTSSVPLLIPVVEVQVSTMELVSSVPLVPMLTPPMSVSLIPSEDPSMPLVPEILTLPVPLHVDGVMELVPLVQVELLLIVLPVMEVGLTTLLPKLVLNEKIKINVN